MMACMPAISLSVGIKRVVFNTLPTRRQVGFLAGLGEFVHSEFAGCKRIRLVSFDSHHLNLFVFE